MEFTTKLRLAYIGLLLGLVLFTCELGSRYFFTRSADFWSICSEFQFDQTLGWKGIPNFEGNLGGPAGLVAIKINADGFRDDDWKSKLAEAKHLGLSKILFLGDSVLYGLGIEKSERLSEQLEDLYSYQGRRIMTFNAGIPGYGTGQEFRTFQLLHDRIAPETVVLRWYGNDVGDSALPYDHRVPDRRVYKPFYDTEGNLRLYERVPRRFSALVEGSCLDIFKQSILLMLFSIEYTISGIN